MKVNIGGITIDDGTVKEEYAQLEEGLMEMGIDTESEVTNWVSELSVEDFGELIEIIAGILGF